MRDPLTNFSTFEVLCPPRVDWRSIQLLLLGQGILVGASVLVCSLLKVPPQVPVFDAESMKLAVQIAVPMIVGGLIFDRLPFQPFRKISRDTSIFTLRLLGRSTPPAVAAVVALLISATAGFCEEYAFRGLLFTYLAHTLGAPAALIGSSLLFGLAHFPLFGSSGLVESLLGAIFAYSYWVSGYNIAVPIAVHTLYDFATIFLVWLTARGDLQRRVEMLTAKLDSSGAVTIPDEFAVMAKAVSSDKVITCI